MMVTVQWVCPKCRMVHDSTYDDSSIVYLLCISCGWASLPDAVKKPIYRRIK